MGSHITVTGRHLPYGITQCYLLPRHKWMRPTLTPAIYLPRRDGRLSWPKLPGNAPAAIRTRDLSITSPTPYHYTTESTKISQYIVRVTVLTIYFSTHWVSGDCDAFCHLSQPHSWAETKIRQNQRGGHRRDGWILFVVDVHTIAIRRR